MSCRWKNHPGIDLATDWRREMGVKTRNRIVDKPVIPPKVLEINDENYRGAHPDSINFPHEETIADGKRTVELKAFTRKGLEQLRRIAEEQFLPLLEAENLNCAVLCEKRRDSGTGRIVRGVCFNSGWGPQERGERQAIMLRHPDADDPRVAAVLLHEVAHLTEDNHGSGFKARLGQLISKAVADGTPFSHWRLDLLALAKGDRYGPIPPQGTWDDYFNGTPALDYEVLPGQVELSTGIAVGPAAYGVKDWGYSEDLIPERQRWRTEVSIDPQELVETYLDLNRAVSDDGRYDWDTGTVGTALGIAYKQALRANGIDTTTADLLVRSMDLKAAIKSNLETVQKTLDDEVARRREQDGEVPF